MKDKNYKHLLIIIVVITSLVWLLGFSFPDQKLNLIFCDVGQGDAILISQGFNQVLIDGGPNDRVLECISHNMPLFDRKIEIVALTHPEADHMNGLIPVLDKYEVDYFFTGPEGNQTAAYAALISKLKSLMSRWGLSFSGQMQLKVMNLYTGEKIRLGNIILESVWPEREWVAGHLNGGGVILTENEEFPGYFFQAKSSQNELMPNDYQTTIISARGNKEAILGVNSAISSLNEFSLIFLLRYKGKSVLLMGDGDIGIQKDILNVNNLSTVDILKFPHHGSKTGMSEDFFKIIKPKEAVISVGKNSFGHPTKEALDLLNKFNVTIRRTDLEGEIKYSF